MTLLLVAVSMLLVGAIFSKIIFSLNANKIKGLVSNSNHLSDDHNSGEDRTQLLMVILTCMALLLTFFHAIDVLLISKSTSWFVLPWTIWSEKMIFRFDSLSAFFLLPISFLALMATIYSYGYFKTKEQVGHAHSINLGSMWSAYQLLIASMILVLISKSTLLFLLSWELMSLSSFLLVLCESEKAETRRAAWIYLSLTHIGTAALLIYFMLVDNPSNSPAVISLCFFMALFGFGTKAGVVPSHIWLPEAHPAAPSPVSCLMSGAMIKTGIYGILRSIMTLSSHLDLQSSLPISWGIVVFTLGMMSGIFGILLALSQHELKRLLAYSSVENIGIILMGIGLGLVGISTKSSTLTFFGFAGALLHVLNHALFKGLLFLGAGQVIKSTGITNIDQMGGMNRYLPVTVVTFFIGAAAIVGLPPFNGFISELLIYLGPLKEIINLSTGTISTSPQVISQTMTISVPIIISVLAILSLALIGGLALLCFTKVFGMVFLGEMRSPELVDLDEYNVKENEKSMLLPMVVLSTVCLLMGLFPFITLPILSNPMGIIISSAIKTQVPAETHSIYSAYWLQMEESLQIMKNVSMVLAILISLVALLFIIRNVLIKRRKVTITGTWDCGYERPTSRMQYTASSFAWSLIKFFKPVLRTKKEFDKIEQYFPVSKELSLKTHTGDVVAEMGYQVFYQKMLLFFNKIIKIQHGKIHFYVIYIVVFLTILLLINGNINHVK